MAGRHLLQLVLRLGEHGGHQLAEALVEAMRIAAAGLGKDEPAAIDVVAELVRVGQQRDRPAAADVEHRRLQQIFDRGPLGVDRLPGEPQIPFLLGVRDEIGRIAAMLIPMLRLAVFELRHHDGPPPFGEKQQRQRRADVRLLLRVPRCLANSARADPDRLTRILGPFAVPIVIADEPPRREPPGPLEAVQIVVETRLPRTGRPRIAAHRKMIARANRRPAPAHGLA